MRRREDRINQDVPILDTFCSRLLQHYVVLSKARHRTIALFVAHFLLIHAGLLTRFLTSRLLDAAQTHSHTHRHTHTTAEERIPTGVNKVVPLLRTHTEAFTPTSTPPIALFLSTPLSCPFLPSCLPTSFSHPNPPSPPTPSASISLKHTHIHA